METTSSDGGTDIWPFSLWDSFIETENDISAFANISLDEENVAVEGDRISERVLTLERADGSYKMGNLQSDYGISIDSTKEIKEKDAMQLLDIRSVCFGGENVNVESDKCSKAKRRLRVSFKDDNLQASKRKTSNGQAKSGNQRRRKKHQNAEVPALQEENVRETSLDGTDTDVRTTNGRSFRCNDVTEGKMGRSIRNRSVDITNTKVFRKITIEQAKNSTKRKKLKLHPSGFISSGSKKSRSADTPNSHCQVKAEHSPDSIEIIPFRMLHNKRTKTTKNKYTGYKCSHRESKRSKIISRLKVYKEHDEAKEKMSDGGDTDVKNGICYTETDVSIQCIDLTKDENTKKVVPDIRVEYDDIPNYTHNVDWYKYSTQKRKLELDARAGRSGWVPCTSEKPRTTDTPDTTCQVMAAHTPGSNKIPLFHKKSTKTTEKNYNCYKCFYRGNKRSKIISHLKIHLEQANAKEKSSDGGDTDVKNEIYYPDTDMSIECIDLTKDENSKLVVPDDIASSTADRKVKVDWYKHSTQKRKLELNAVVPSGCFLCRSKKPRSTGDTPNRNFQVMATHTSGSNEILRLHKKSNKTTGEKYNCYKCFFSGNKRSKIISHLKIHLEPVNVTEKLSDGGDTDIKNEICHSDTDMSIECIDLTKDENTKKVVPHVKVRNDDNTSSMADRKVNVDRYKHSTQKRKLELNAVVPSGCFPCRSKKPRSTGDTPYRNSQVMASNFHTSGSNEVLMFHEKSNKTTGKKYNCYKCFYRSNNRSKIISHLKIHLEPVNVTEKLSDGGDTDIKNEICHSDTDMSIECIDLTKDENIKKVVPHVKVRYDDITSSMADRKVNVDRYKHSTLKRKLELNAVVPSGCFPCRSKKPRSACDTPNRKFQVMATHTSGSSEILRLHKKSNKTTGEKYNCYKCFYSGNKRSKIISHLKIHLEPVNVKEKLSDGGDTDIKNEICHSDTDMSIECIDLTKDENTKKVVPHVKVRNDDITSSMADRKANVDRYKHSTQKRKLELNAVVPSGCFPCRSKKPRSTGDTPNRNFQVMATHTSGSNEVLMFHENSNKTTGKNYNCYKCFYRSNNRSKIISHLKIHLERVNVKEKLSDGGDTNLKNVPCSTENGISIECSDQTRKTMERDVGIKLDVSTSTLCGGNFTAEQVKNSTEKKNVEIDSQAGLSVPCRSNVPTSTDTLNTVRQVNAAHALTSIDIQPLGMLHKKTTKTVEKKYNCYRCFYTGNKRSEIISHLTIHSAVKRYRCTYCYYECKQTYLIEYHIMLAHPEKEPIKYQDNICSQEGGTHKTQTEKVSFACHLCDYRASGVIQQKRHVMTHNADEHFRCDSCDYISNFKGNLKRHMKTHSGEKPFACDYCDYRCNKKLDLRRHMMRSHSEIPFASAVCDNRSSKEDNLTNYVHHMEKQFPCNSCDYRCSASSPLKEHTKTHTEKKPFSCQICNYRTRTTDLLKVHIRTHTGEKPFACDLCDYRSTSFGYLKRHIMRIHSRENPFERNSPNYERCEARYLKTHSRTHTDERSFACALCDYRCTKTSTLEVHMIKHSRVKPFACNLCNFKSKHKFSLKRHNIMIHLNGEKPFACDFCDFRSTRFGELRLHTMRMHSGEKPFEFNSSNYEHHEESLTTHSRTHTEERSFASDLSEYRSTTSSTLRIHMRKHTGEKLFACNLCNFKCNRKSSLRRHIMIHQNAEKPFACDFCEYRSTTSSTLRIHVRKHTGEKPFACNLCNFKCNRKSNLRRHIMIHQNAEKPFACDFCEYRSTTSSTLRIHVRKHTEEKPFACNLCNFKCNQKSSLRRHIMIHQNSEKPFACNLCNFKCNRKSSLRRHIVIHQNAEKPFACDFCEYRSTTSSTLRIHVRKHTGEKPFACNLCNFKCNQKSSLRRHIMIHQNAEKPFACDFCEYRSTTSSTLRIHVRKHTGEKPFACNLCNFKCNQKSSLRRHIMIHQNAEKPFACNLCNFKCNQKSSLRRHIMILHNEEKPFACDSMTIEVPGLVS